MREQQLLKAQRNEETEHLIYKRLAGRSTGKNKHVLEEITADEKRHASVLHEHTKKQVKPRRIIIAWYLLLARTFGLAFSLKLMERGEEVAQDVYKHAKEKDLYSLWLDEQRHEKEILRMLQDDRVEYAGSIVLGLNDALVELTGALAGMSLALSNTRTIATVGFITGFAASLSMAASSYLSSREEEHEGKDPLKGAIYTGTTYIIVVITLILPYLFLQNRFIALSIMLTLSIIIISIYTYYISVAKETPFKRRFLEMALISLGVATISFCLAWAIRNIFGIDA